ncbi:MULTISPECIES: hypothetical protein [Streptomyces]|uniref:HEAT repeat domain-containing protein n=1 Tax=Streptomyces ehimensis TaxID=68195 RepID=A0ABV9BKP5_9ACTN
MEYRSPGEISQEEAEEIFATGEVSEICPALISAALHLPDREWVEEYILAFLKHEDADVRRCAAVSSGHVARIHGALGQGVRDALRLLLADSVVSGAAEDAMDDVEMFARRA